MKYSNIVGLLFALILMGACFLPWAYYPDLDKYFNGFFSEKNMYGKPGKALIALSVLTILLFAMPRVWAKRANLLVSAVLLAFCIKTFLLFSSCYQGICPEKKIGLWLILCCPVIVVLAAVLPDLKLNKKHPDQNP